MFLQETFEIIQTYNAKRLRQKGIYKNMSAATPIYKPENMNIVKVQSENMTNAESKCEL